MTPFAYKKNALHIENVPLEKIARDFGTPVYCYSATRIEENFDAYDRAMRRVTSPDRFTICYACKANSNLAVLKLLKKKGAGADIVSGGELARALKAGIPAAKIVFSGVGKNEEELETAIHAGIFQINVESEPELVSISRIARRLKKTVSVAIRVNPDVDAKTHSKISTGRKEDKFGIDIVDAPKLYKKAKALPGIRACSVSVHIGSQLTSVAPYRRAYLRVAELVKKLRRQGHDITRVDLGGGAGITYRDEKPLDLDLYALMVRDVILPLDVHVVLEPGRRIVGDAGILLTRVRHIKQGHNKKFLILDAAMNDLARPSLYDAYHPVWPVKPGGRKETYDVVGPVCESSDIFVAGEKLPAMNPGDLVAIMVGGAYGAVMASSYNTRPLVPEVLVRGGEYSLIRRKQTIADLLKQDIVPGWV